MRVPDRLRQLVEQEHAQVRAAMARFDEALAELERQQRANRAPPVTKNLFGDVVKSEAIPEAGKQRMYALGPLKDVWFPLRRQLAARLDRTRDELVVAVDAFFAATEADAGPLLPPVLKLVDALGTAQAELRPRLADLRKQVVFVDPMKAASHALVVAVDAAEAAEQGELFPALLSGSRETARPAPTNLSSDDIVRRLRTAPPAVDRDDEPPPPPGLLGRLRKWLGG